MQEESQKSEVERMIFRMTTQYHTPGRQREECQLPAQPESEGRQICVMVCTAAIGLLVLYTFLSSGGICASLAPWVMLAGARANVHRTGWRRWSGISGVMFFCLGLVALLAPAHVGITSFTGGLLGLICGLRYLVPVFLVDF